MYVVKYANRAIGIQDLICYNTFCLYFSRNLFQICSYMPPCGRLWCTTSGGEEASGCRTQHMPWADGTPCGPSAWCIKSQCVSKSSKTSRVEGGWGSWGPWSQCSQTCGGGIRSSKRECSDPKPSGGGLYCLGDRVR